MMTVLTFNKYLVMLCLLVYFLDHLWMTSSLFDVNIYCRLFFISKLLNCVTSDPLLHSGFKIRKFSHVVQRLADLILYLVSLENRTHGFFYVY